jgi:hypothetical protein
VPADHASVRPRGLALLLELILWFAAGIVFLIWGTSRYRGLTYCPFDDPTVGHPYVIGAVIAGSAALIAIGIERAVARRRWPTAAAVGLMMLALVCAAIYIAQSLSAVATGALTSFPLAGRAPLDFTLTVTVLDHSHLPRGLSYLDGAPLQSWIIRPRIVRARRDASGCCLATSRTLARTLEPSLNWDRPADAQGRRIRPWSASHTSRLIAQLALRT